MASDESQGRTGSEHPTPAAPLLRALALDPGGTTGYAICDINMVSKKLKIGWDQAKFNESELTELFETFVPDVIIYEGFEYRNRARAGLDLTPPKLIGVIKLYAQSTGTRLYEQSAAMGKGHYSDQRLKTLGFYQRGMPHGRDALRHLLHWLTFRAGNEYMDFLKAEIDILPVDVIMFHGSLGTDST